VVNNYVTVHVHDPATVLVFPADTTVCGGSPVQMSAFGATSYVWSPAKYLDRDSIQTPTARVDSTTTFKVEGFDGYCYIDVKNTINVLPAPKVYAGRHAVIHTNESYIINDASVTGNYFQYHWRPARFMNDSTVMHPTVSPTTSMWYILWAVNAYGCASQDSVYIKFDPIGHVFVPSAFTPNHDGKNDFLQVKKDNIKTFHMEIFDRWGEIVFMVDNLYDSWDGTYNGKPAPIGTYVYFVEATDIGGSPVNSQGNVTLIR
jgi:gliding motility-associated-like protein